MHRKIKAKKVFVEFMENPSEMVNDKCKMVNPSVMMNGKCKFLNLPFTVYHLKLINELHAKIILFQSKYQDWVNFFLLK